MFDRDALLVAMENNARQFGTIPQYTAAGNEGIISVTANNTNLVTSAGVYNGLPLNSTLNNLSTIIQFNAATQNPNLTSNNANINSPGFIQLHGDQPGEYWTYEDQIPPFDITVTLANEYGNAANMIITDVEILNEGMGISIDDINLERACTFIARGVQRLRPGFNTSGTANTSTPISQSSVGVNAGSFSPSGGG